MRFERHGQWCHYKAALLAAMLFVIFAAVSLPPVAAVLRARHHCVPAATVSKALGQHPDCVDLVDGPTCTEVTVRDDGCRDTRVRNFTVCGALTYNEVEDPEPPLLLRQAIDLLSRPTGGARTFSHCAYAARPAGTPCDLGLHEGGVARGGAADSSGSHSAGAAAADGGSPTSAGLAGNAAPGRLMYECGGGGLAGMCVPAGRHGPEHPQCVEFTCNKGLCGSPVPANEGGECAPTHGPAPPPAPPPCQRRACRSGRCVVEPLPDDTTCGPVGRCAEHVCRAGMCVRNAEEDGVLCGPGSACSSQVCEAGECVEERRPDGRLCWHAPGQCPSTCAAVQCVACNCGSAFAFWAGRQRLPELQWAPFLTDLKENSFGGYFNLLNEELDIPPVQLPYNESVSGALYGTSYDDGDSAILVCSGCRLNMRLQPGSNMVQDGALVTGSVGLATSTVRGGTYVSLDVVMFPNATHDHLLVGWNPWAGLSPPPVHAPQRWGGPPQPKPVGGSSVSPASASASTTAEPGVPHAAPKYAGALPRPAAQHSAWAFVRRRPVRWAFTSLEQVRSLFVGLHLTVASCSLAPPLTATPTGQGPGGNPPDSTPSSPASPSSPRSPSQALRC